MMKYKMFLTNQIYLNDFTVILVIKEYVIHSYSRLYHEIKHWNSLYRTLVNLLDNIMHHYVDHLGMLVDRIANFDNVSYCDKFVKGIQSNRQF